MFVCSTTGTTSMWMMDDFRTISFFQAFIRLSCEVGYPKILLTDEGSQFLKACKTMEFDFHDVKQKLYTGHNVEFDVCPVGIICMGVWNEKSKKSKRLSKCRSQIKDCL